MGVIYLILLTLVLSAFFSGMEIAFVSSNKLRFELDKKHGRVSSFILSIFYRNPKQFISTMLVGNNICMVVYGLSMASLLAPYLVFLHSPFFIALVQAIIATIIVLFTSEFLPKTIFRVNSNFWLRFFSVFLLLVYVLLYPISRFCTSLSTLILRILGIKSDEKTEGNAFSRADLNYLLQESFDPESNTEEIENEVKILQNALDFSKVKLRDCYTPRTEIVALDWNVDVDTLKQTFIETGLSKILIYKGDIDNIIGYMRASMLFNSHGDLRKQISSIPIVPENMAAQKLMKTFMQEKKSIAVVVDEFGGTAGLVTLEDIFEEIFGEIEDEYDSHNLVAERLGENEYVFSGRWEVDQLNEQYNIGIPESDEYDTMAGFILFYHQLFPKLNELIVIEQFEIKCTKITNNRIEMVHLWITDMENSKIS